MKHEVPYKLEMFIASLPLPPPSRTVVVDGIAIVEWQIDGKYYEIELDNNNLSIMAEINGQTIYWDVTDGFE